MPAPSPYRSLPAARRVALVAHAIQANRAARTLYVQRLVARGGGFRAVTLQSWPAERLAREVVRTGAETPHDELDLLQLLYVDLEPDIQSTFLDAAGVAADLPGAVDAVDPRYSELFGWVLREGVTNAVRHARAARVSVALGESWIEVEDNGRGAAPDASGDGSGLRGLTERVADADRSSLANNLVVVRVLDAARRSAREGRTVRLEP